MIARMMDMGQFGEDLRRERESRGIPLEAITNSTKISSRHLSALEEEQFERLPGGVFNKGIVRGYARVVGLDEEAWVGRFMSAYRSSGQVKEDDADWTKFAEGVVKSRQTEGARPALRLRWAGVILLLVLLAAFGLYVAHYVQGRVSAADRTHTSNTVEPKTVEPRTTIDAAAWQPFNAIDLA
jgi:cytoskeleton protein RodZ